MEEFEFGPKKSNDGAGRRIIVRSLIAFMAVTAVVSAFYFHSDSVEKVDEEPPSIAINMGSNLQGMMAGKKISILATWDEEDEKAYESGLKNWLEDNEKEAMKEITAGVPHFMYASDDISAAQIAQRVDLSDSEILLVTFMDSKWHVFPDLGKDQDGDYKIVNYDFDQAEKFQLQSGQGYLLFTTKNTTAFDLANEEDSFNGKFEASLNSGWNLIAFSESVADQFKKEVTNVWQIEKNTAVSKDSHKDVKSSIIWMFYSDDDVIEQDVPSLDSDDDNEEDADADEGDNSDDDKVAVDGGDLDGDANDDLLRPDDDDDDVIQLPDDKRGEVQVDGVIKDHIDRDKIKELEDYVREPQKPIPTPRDCLINPDCDDLQKDHKIIDKDDLIKGVSEKDLIADKMKDVIIYEEDLRDKEDLKKKEIVEDVQDKMKDIAVIENQLDAKEELEKKKVIENVQDKMKEVAISENGMKDDSKIISANDLKKGAAENEAVQIEQDEVGVVNKDSLRKLMPKNEMAENYGEEAQANAAPQAEEANENQGAAEEQVSAMANEQAAEQQEPEIKKKVEMDGVSTGIAAGMENLKDQSEMAGFENKVEGMQSFVNAQEKMMNPAQMNPGMKFQGKLTLNDDETASVPFVYGVYSIVAEVLLNSIDN